MKYRKLPKGNPKGALWEIAEMVKYNPPQKALIEGKGACGEIAQMVKYKKTSPKALTTWRTTPSSSHNQLFCCVRLVLYKIFSEFGLQKTGQNRA